MKNRMRGSGRIGGMVALLAVLDVLIWGVVVTGICGALTGCATGNKAEISLLPKSNKSTTAENIEAGGKVAAAALDRVGKIFNKQ